MKMKKAAASAMAAMIALSMLAGCGDNNTSENNSSKSSESTGSSASAERCDNLVLLGDRGSSESIGQSYTGLQCFSGCL